MSKQKLKKTKSKMGKKILLLSFIFSLLSFLVIAYQVFIVEPETQNLLESIDENTYTPKPQLVSKSECYIIEPSDVEKYFGLSNVTRSYYLDQFILSSSVTYANEPWIRVVVPSGLDYVDVTTIPSVSHSVKVEEDASKIISIPFESLNLAPGDEIRIMIIYERAFLDKLMEEYRSFNFGSREASGNYNYLRCKYDGFKLLEEA